MDYSFDHHVHCGQYEKLYFQPAFVIQALHDNGVKRVWLSSTTSNIRWRNGKEKKQLIEHVEAEIKEALEAGCKYDVEVYPLYWVIPQRHYEGETVTDVMRNFPYKGFKIHPRMADWDNKKADNMSLFHEICEYANNNSVPILIHTGVDYIDLPERFEKFFSYYPSVSFVLAHCRKTGSIIRLFSQYNNVFGDCALCNDSSFRTIYRAGYYNRMYFGTDFPISYWFETNHTNNRTITYDELFGHYQRLITSVSKKSLVG